MNSVRGIVWTMCVGLALLLGAHAYSFSPSKQELTVATNANKDAAAVAAIDNYVKRTRQWPKDSYRIEFKRREKNVLVYWVIHTDDEKSIVPGGGKSFEIHIDSADQHVIAEYHFQ